MAPKDPTEQEDASLAAFKKEQRQRNLIAARKEAGAISQHLDLCYGAPLSSASKEKLARWLLRLKRCVPLAQAWHDAYDAHQKPGGRKWIGEMTNSVAMLTELAVDRSSVAQFGRALLGSTKDGREVLDVLNLLAKKGPKVLEVIKRESVEPRMVKLEKPPKPKNEKVRLTPKQAKLQRREIRTVLMGQTLHKLFHRICPDTTFLKASKPKCPDDIRDRELWGPGPMFISMVLSFLGYKPPRNGQDIRVAMRRLKQSQADNL